MTEEKKRPKDQPFSLEELNQQFSSGVTRKKRQKEISGIWKLILAAGVVLIAALVVWRLSAGTSSTRSARDSEAMPVTGNEIQGTSAVGREPNPESDPGAGTEANQEASSTDTESQSSVSTEPETSNTVEPETFHESILSEEEQEKWMSKELSGDNIYVELNSRIYLDGTNAYIRLINPIYSAYYYSITIYPKDEEETILYQSEKIAPGTILEAVVLSKEPTGEQYPAVVKYLVYDEKGSGLGTYSVDVEFTTDEQYK